MPNLISIVIPTLNEERYLPRLLSNLTDQTFTDFEVIVVDGNSSDKTTDKAQEFSSELSITILQTEIRHVSHQRNLGADAATSEWVLFLDADVQIDANYLEELASQISQQKVDVFSCYMKLKKKHHIPLAVISNLFFELSLAANTPNALGACIGAHRAVFEQCRFDENQMIVEDSLFIEDAVSKGFVYKFFSRPRYYFSMRRIEKEGYLKMSIITSKMIVKRFSDNDFTESDLGYVMKGGKYYDKSGKLVELPASLERMYAWLSKLSVQQKQKARRLVRRISDDLNKDN